MVPLHCHERPQGAKDWGLRNDADATNPARHVREKEPLSLRLRRNTGIVVAILVQTLKLIWVDVKLR